MGVVVKTQGQVTAPVRPGDALRIKSNVFLAGPTQALQGTALDLVDDTIEVHIEDAHLSEHQASRQHGAPEATIRLTR